MNSGGSINPGKYGVALVFLTVAGLLLVNVGVTYWVGHRTVESDLKLSAQRSVIQHLDELLSSLKDAETGQRGYLLVGTEPYLEPYYAAGATIEAELKTLVDLASEGELPKEAVARAQVLTRQKLAELNATIKDRRNRGIEAALSIMRADRGKRIMDDIRSVVGDMKTIKEADFDQAQQTADKATATRTAVFLVTTLLNLALLAWAYYGIANEIHRREIASVETGRQKDLLAITLASIGDGVIVTDTEARITFMNRVAASLTGYSAEESQGLEITEVFRIINQETRAEVENPVYKVLKTGAVVGLANHTILVRKDGRELPIDDSGAPVCRANGRAHGVVLIFRDITERKEAERGLRESEVRFHTMANSIPQLAWIARADGYIYWYNQRWYEYTGSTPEQMKGWGWQSVHDPNVLPQVLEQWKASIATGRPFDMVFPLRGTDGQFRPFLTRVVPSKNAQGQVVQWFGTNTDIAESRQAEEALRESEERFRLLFQQAAVGIKRLDAQERLLEVNDKLSDILGYSRDELLQLSLTDFTHPEDLPHERAKLARLMAREIPYYGIEKRCLRKDGSIIWVRVTSSLPSRNDGHTPWWISVVEDITQHKQDEEAMLQAKAAAEEANQAKDRFVANISHELRTPMNAILGMIELAIPNVAEPTARDFLYTARESADLLLALLNDLLDCAKLESGKLELTPAPFSLRLVVDQTTRAMAVRAKEKGISFSCQTSADIPDALVGDAVRLRQILLNLAGNAIKFTEQGEVAVSVRVQSQTSEEACLEFAVRDTGIGIPHGEMERIFKPFAQADGSTGRRFGGTGLGLSISADLVAMMGGCIWVESELGQGSTFHFIIHLPLARELPSKQGPSFDGPAAPAKLLRILLVEDTPANQKLASHILKERGHTVEIAKDGHQALGMTKENRYDVILMDVQMPGMDGLETTAAIRAGESGSRRVPIIAMTARAMKGDRERCLTHGMDGYLSKPIDAREMIALVEGLAAGTAAAAPKPAPAKPASQPSAAVFDPELALKRCSGNQNVLVNMTQCFFEEVRDLFPQLRGALERGDMTEVGRLGHRLKGTVVYLGAEPTIRAAIAVEQFEKGDGNQTEAKEAVRSLEYECESLERTLIAHDPRLPAAKVNSVSEST